MASTRPCTNALPDGAGQAWESISTLLARDRDNDYLMIDSSIVDLLPVSWTVLSWKIPVMIGGPGYG